MYLVASLIQKKSMNASVLTSIRIPAHFLHFFSSLDSLSWGYDQYFERVAGAIRQAFPSLAVTGNEKQPRRGEFIFRVLPPPVSSSPHPVVSTSCYAGAFQVSLDGVEIVPGKLETGKFASIGAILDAIEAKTGQKAAVRPADAETVPGNKCSIM